MGGLFFGLQIGKTGLFASQVGLNTTANNISNAGTDGYTRQRVYQSSIPSYAFTSGQRGKSGGGVNIDYIGQIRNKFLDVQYRNENSTYKDLETKNSTFYYIDDVINGSSDTGLSSVLTTFYKSMQQMSKTPDAKDTRTLVKQNALAVVETLNSYSKGLTNLQADQDNAIGVTVGQINDIVKQVSDLNKEIVKYEITGAKANELLDRRNLLLDNLSSLVDISVKEDADGNVSIFMGKGKNIAASQQDYCLLNGTTDDIYSLSATKALPNYSGQANEFYKVELTSASGNTITIDSNTIEGGQLKGYFDMRDGNTSNNLGIPYVLAQYDKLAQGIVKAYNDVHKNGYSIPDESNGNVSKTGIKFFDDQGGDISKVTAGNIKLSAEIEQSVYNIAASSQKVDLNSPNTNIGNNKNALKLAEISESKTLSVIGNIDEFIKGILSDVAVSMSHNETICDNQKTLTDNLEDKRQDVSGVNADEEVTYAISYSKAFKAASRVITSIDEMLDTLISKTGIVGR